MSLPTLEDRMDDVRAVMDAVGSEKATLFGHSEGGNMCLVFAATYPRTHRGPDPHRLLSKRIKSDDYPWAPAWEERLGQIERSSRTGRGR
jgi:pimeloyl-ACP methyl ester carboxylesterase